MSISGLMITLAEEPHQRAAALQALSAHRCIEVGEMADHRVAVVAETSNSDEDAALWDWLRSLAGVRFVDVTFVHFDDQPSHADGHEPAPK